MRCPRSSSANQQTPFLLPGYLIRARRKERFKRVPILAILKLDSSPFKVLKKSEKVPKRLCQSARSENECQKNELQINGCD